MVADSDETRPSSRPWLFLLGLLVFLGSVLLFLVDLFRGVAIIRSVSANAVGAVILMVWAALDTLTDPNSDVESRGGATGTALLLYGIYLFLAGITIAVTGLLFHDQLQLGLWYLGLAVLGILVGFLIFPAGTVVDEDDTDDEAASGAPNDDTGHGDGSHDGEDDHDRSHDGGRNGSGVDEREGR
jgi:hypothetical protein